MSTTTSATIPATATTEPSLNKRLRLLGDERNWPTTATVATVFYDGPVSRSRFRGANVRSVTTLRLVLVAVLLGAVTASSSLASSSNVVRRVAFVAIVGHG